MFSTKLKELRSLKGITQEELANILGVRQQTIGKWELSITVPRLPMLQKIGAFFNVSVDYLLGRTDEPGGSVSNAGVTESRPLYDSGIKIMNELIRIEDSLKKLTAKESTGIKDVYVDIANKLYDIEFELFRAEDQYHNRKLMEKEQKIVFALKVQQLMKENNISEAAASEIVAETQKNQYKLNIRQAFNESRRFTLSSIGALVDIQDMEKSMASSTTSAINKFKQQIQAFPGFKNNAFHASAPSVEDLKILDTAFFRKLYEEQKYDNQHRILPEMFWLPDFIKELKSAADRYNHIPQQSLVTAKTICSNFRITINKYNKSPI